nr:MAG TPA: hypothetical protein [Crassvirales sp.]
MLLVSQLVASLVDIPHSQVSILCIIIIVMIIYSNFMSISSH